MTVRDTDDVIRSMDGTDRIGHENGHRRENRKSGVSREHPKANRTAPHHILFIDQPTDRPNKPATPQNVNRSVDGNSLVVTLLFGAFFL